ncbi:MAG: futalosine hydrolase [Bacteroidota bacterium]|nr:futalosine hydrolase [Bacteroidota bacterium]
MKILLVSATAFEVEPYMRDHPSTEVLITGVGIPSAMFQLTGKLLRQEYNLVIQAGIAGVYDNKIEKGAVVVVERDTFGDLGVYEKGSFRSLFETGLLDENDLPYKNGWLCNPHKLQEQLDLQKVRGLTINTLTDDPESITRIRNKFNADIETMEGAAFHYACLMLKVPFLQLRSVSNLVGERDKGKWNIQEAVTHLNYEISKTIRNLSQ